LVLPLEAANWQLQQIYNIQADNLKVKLRQGKDAADTNLLNYISSPILRFIRELELKIYPQNRFSNHGYALNEALLFKCRHLRIYQHRRFLVKHRQTGQS